MAAHDSGFSGERHEEGDNRDGDDQLLELQELPPPVPAVPGRSEGDVLGILDGTQGLKFVFERSYHIITEAYGITI